MRFRRFRSGRKRFKGLWDADRVLGCPLHVVIMGSAPLLMQSGLSESLTGRFEPIRVAHWSFAEISAAFGFDLPHYLYFGGYPEAYGLVGQEARWRDYILGAVVEPNIERDILALTRVDKPALLKRLFELGAAYSGQILSYNKMLGQLDDAGNTTTLARYLDLLGHGRTRHRPAEIHRYGCWATCVQSQAQRAQYGADDRRLRILLRRSDRGPDILGTDRGDRGGRAPVQHRGLQRSSTLLATRLARGGLRPAARAAAGRDRGQERQRAQASDLRRCRGSGNSNGSIVLVARCWSERAAYRLQSSSQRPPAIGLKKHESHRPPHLH